MMRSVLVVLLVLAVSVYSYVVYPLATKPSVCLFGSLDYEYMPPNNEEPPCLSNLPSIYPEGTPAGLRGEAVRSALRSGRCIAWNLKGTPLEFGVVRASGRGCIEFLNNKLTQSFSPRRDGAQSTFQHTCLLNSKGRLVDQLGVAITSDETAYIITSSGHKASELFQRMEPFIFPLDLVALTDESADSFIFTLASVERGDVQTVFDQYIQPWLSDDGETKISLPTDGHSLMLSIRGSFDCTLLILPFFGLPACAGSGCTFCFLNDKASLGFRILASCTSESSPNGPILIGAREFETLRIETGQPAFGKEITAHEKDPPHTPASPLELHMHPMIDNEKGCYLGQEGIASLLKNPRGPPRMLYQIIFEDEFNIYDHQSAGDRSGVENLTRIPACGDQLFVLGSNEQIPVGYISSIAEPGSTGDAVTLGLVLTRRADSILRQMKEMDLEIKLESTSLATDAAFVIDLENESGIASLPHKDPLDGLEVIIGGSFTVGTLKSVPSRRFRRSEIMFTDEFSTQGKMTDESVVDVRWSQESVSATKLMDDSDEELKQVHVEVEKAKEAAESAGTEARRKAEKLEQLRKRAEEAMARRLKQNEG